MNRGRDHGTTFHGSPWYRAFFKCLSEAHDRFGAQIHAYCLMSNHYHLLIKTDDSNLARIMRHINGVYTQRHNALSNTDGSLWRGRYKSNLVQEAIYWSTLARYIHRNPIETSPPLVKRLEDYPWSSYRYYVGLDTPPPWLYLDETYQHCAIDNPRAFKRFVAQPHDEQLVRSLDWCEKSAPILGTADFRREKLATAGQITPETPKWQTRTHRPTIDDILSAVAQHYGLHVHRLARPSRTTSVLIARDAAMHICQEFGGHKVRSIGESFGYSSYGGVASRLHHIRRRIKTDIQLRDDIAVLVESLQTKKTT